MPHERAIDRDTLRLAERQHGVVARRQLLALGMTVETIVHRVRIGRLVRVRRGVYALGHRALRPEARWMTAVLVCGEGAVLSHRSAARVWGLRPWSGEVELTVPSHGGRRRHEGILLHRSADLPTDEITLERGLPVTTVHRTLLDLASVVPAHHLRRAVERAEQLELFDLVALRHTLDAHPRRAGAPAVVALLKDVRDGGMTSTHSDTEAGFLQLCIDHRIERPLVNRYNNGREVDFRWPARGLLVEVDGWATHKTRGAFQRDRARDRLALREGMRVARFTAGEVERTPQAVATELRALLALIASG